MDQLEVIFGKKMKEARLKMGLSQAELASLTGVSQKSIDYYEKGERNPKVAAKEKIIEVLKIQELSTNVPREILSATVPIQRLLEEVERSRDDLKSSRDMLARVIEANLTQLLTGQNVMMAHIIAGIERAALVEAKGNPKRQEEIMAEISKRIAERLVGNPAGGNIAGVHK